MQENKLSGRQLRMTINIASLMKSTASEESPLNSDLENHFSPKIHVCKPKNIYVLTIETRFFFAVILSFVSATELKQLYLQRYRWKRW